MKGKGGDGRRSQGGTSKRRCQAGTQATAMTEAHTAVEGGRSHAGEALNDIMGTSDGDGANGGGALGADGELMRLGNTAGPGDRDGSTATTVHGETEVP